MKNKILLRWNTCKINLIARLAASLNREVCDENALWDTAQNTMEKSVKGNPERLANVGDNLDILRHRAMERVDDIHIEQRDALNKQMQGENDYPDPHYGTMSDGV